MVCLLIIVMLNRCFYFLTSNRTLLSCRPLNMSLFVYDLVFCSVYIVIFTTFRKASVKMVWVSEQQIVYLCCPKSI